MANDKEPTAQDRDFKGRGLSEYLPRPNIVRIEILDGNKRQRYLGAVHKAGDNLRQKVYANTVKPQDTVFYGYLTADNKINFDLGADWVKSAGGSGVLGALKGLAGSITAGATSKASDVISGVGNVVNSFLGTNSTATGSATLKDFDSVKLSNMSVKCGWYIPEQEALCKRSLQILYKMLYPASVNTNALAEMLPQIVTSAVETLVKPLAEAAKPIDAELEKMAANGGAVAKGVNAVANAVESGVETVAPITMDMLASGAGNGLVQAALKSYISFGEAFGNKITMNPLPIRLCVGQQIDIEPLIITNISSEFSQETFISSDGRHLPIFVYTTIQFNFWLNPTPDMQFASILGTEIFGTN